MSKMTDYDDSLADVVDFIEFFDFANEINAYALASKYGRTRLPAATAASLLVALRFYGAGIFQVVTGDLVNVPQPTVSTVVARLSMMIAASLYPAPRIFDSINAWAQYEDGSAPGVLLGDQGYACRAYMLTPLRDPGRPGSPQYK
ncbi:hypothetical protein HPB48_019048 [Haemaphysalis longicornis]|uniref:Nuclease HARBI1 n=1 Tax=Haemaphysalis longicornis TaxID=44386 RepID=A0A9J6GFE1_HAELO|nr:hypothetical protein HPB48_019048 [Haemaphysalis longicornis]